MHNYHNKIVHHPASERKNPNFSISLPSAILGGAMLITFFLLMSLMGYETTTGLRFLNFVILIPIIIYAQRSYLTHFHAKSYMEAFRVSMLAFWGSYAILAVFMFIYLMVIDPAFLTYLQKFAIPGIKLNSFGVTALLLGEGMIGAVLLSYVILQYFKARIKHVV